MIAPTMPPTIQRENPLLATPRKASDFICEFSRFSRDVYWSWASCSWHCGLSSPYPSPESEVSCYLFDRLRASLDHIYLVGLGCRTKSNARVRFFGFIADYAVVDLR